MPLMQTQIDAISIFICNEVLVSFVDADTLVLNHQAISIHNT